MSAGATAHDAMAPRFDDEQGTGWLLNATQTGLALPSAGLEIPTRETSVTSRFSGLVAAASELVDEMLDAMGFAPALLAY